MNWFSRNNYFHGINDSYFLLFSSLIAYPLTILGK